MLTNIIINVNFLITLVSILNENLKCKMIFHKESTWFRQQVYKSFYDIHCNMEYRKVTMYVVYFYIIGDSHV